MGSYIEIIKIAMMFFPFIALLISIPFILMQYHKFGSISFFKALIIYSFTLYIICAYFLVILPLPSISEVAELTTPRVQLIPFSFIIDFIKNTSLNIGNVHTYIGALKQSCFYVPAYNLFLTMPFAIYLRYYFNLNLKKTIKYTFLLSLFFELTQLSGLYFIYPRGYRLFDVDDLIINTLGGVIGYFVSIPVIKLLPDIDKVDSKSKERGKVVSGFRRTTTLLLDFFLLTFSTSIVASFYKPKYIFEIMIIIYYFFIPLFMNNSTIGEKFLNIKIVDLENKPNILRLFFRRILFILIYIAIPCTISFLIFNLKFEYGIKEILGFIYLGIMLVIYIIVGMKFIFTNKSILYERLSKTKIVSTIK